MKRFLLLALLLTFLGCGKGGDLPSPGPEPTPAPSPAPGYVPSPEMQEIVKAVVPISEPDVAAFYGDFADVLKRDSEIVRTTGDFRLAYSRAGQLMFQKTGVQGKHPSLAKNIDSAIVAVLGLDDVKLNREKAVEVLLALEWALK